jgi:SSS family solute:Na+ symporter
MAARAVQPGLDNPELALPTLATHVLPPWVGGLALAALFAAEISTADAVLFMISTSLTRDLYQAVLRPRATDAQLLRVGRLAAGAGGLMGVVLAVVLPSVASALKIFYGVMTAALFMPLLFGLLTSRPGAAHARAAIAISIVTTGGLLLALEGRPSAAWLPSAAGVALSGLALGSAWASRGEERPGRGSRPPAGPLET